MRLPGGVVAFAVGVLALVGVVVMTTTVGVPVIGGPGGDGAAVQPGRGLRVDVVGDSLVRQASTQLQAGLADAGFDYRVASEPGREMASAFVRGRLDDAAGVDGDILVLATAANDALVREPEGDDGSAYRREMGALAGRFADRCLVIVNARTQVSPLYHPHSAAAVDDDLRAVAAEHPTLVLVDWNEESTGLPASAFAPDGLHFARDPAIPAPDSPAAAAYARAIVSGAQRCAGKVAAAGDAPGSAGVGSDS